MAKVHVADTLHQAADVAIQLNGARGYSKDTVLEWIYRYARCARLVVGETQKWLMGLEYYYGMDRSAGLFRRCSLGSRNVKPEGQIPLQEFLGRHVVGTIA